MHIDLDNEITKVIKSFVDKQGYKSDFYGKELEISNSGDNELLVAYSTKVNLDSKGIIENQKEINCDPRIPPITVSDPKSFDKVDAALRPSLKKLVNGKGIN